MIPRNVLPYALVFFCLIALFSFNIQNVSNPETLSAATGDVDGYLWSDNVGWMAANCATAGPTGNSICGTSNFKMTINSDKTITGYAWSDNIGWIKFGGLSGFPGGGSNAAVNAAGTEVTGWARACGGTLSGNCSLMTDHTDGWDGWISLNCANTGTCGTANYKVDVGLGVLSGYAWGGDVVGWVQFYNTGFTQQCAPTYTCTDTQTSQHTDQWCAVTTTTCGAGQACSATTGQCVSAPAPAGAITFSSTRVTSGETVQISWISTDTLSCTLSGSNGNSWNGGSTGGPVTSTPITGAVTYTLRCTDLAGNQRTIDVETIRITPTVQEI